MPPQAPPDGAPRANLSPTEAASLLELLKQQEDAVESGMTPPHAASSTPNIHASLHTIDDRQPWSLLSQLTVNVAYLGVVLTNDGHQVLQTGLQGATTGLCMYPTSTHARLTVSDFDLRGAGGGPMLRTGPRHESEVDGSALSVSYIANPQDSQADAVVNVSAAPSFVTFDHRCVRDVVHFFKSEQVGGFAFNSTVIHTNTHEGTPDLPISMLSLFFAHCFVCSLHTV